MYGLAGSHRSGKSTLARALADDLGIEFLETKVGDVFADLGLDPKANLPFDKRLDVQNAILRSIETQYALRNGARFVADRTPFDVLGYTMADIRRDTLDDTLQTRVYAHIGTAMQIVQEYMGGVILLRPLPNQPDAPGKAQSCPLYMYHVYLCIKDMIEGAGIMAAELMTTDHDERLVDARQFVQSVNAMYDNMEPEVKLWTPNS